jgi:hypothetical protein
MASCGGIAKGGAGGEKTAGEGRGEAAAAAVASACTIPGTPTIHNNNTRIRSAKTTNAGNREPGYSPIGEKEKLSLSLFLSRLLPPSQQL